MRFVWAVLAFVLALGLIGAGVAQRTVLQGPDTHEIDLEISEPTPYLVIDGAVLNEFEGTQSLRAQADGEIVAAYGRTADMTAWLSESTYTLITLDDAGEVTTRTVEPAESADEPAAEEPGAEEPAAEEPATEDAAEVTPGRSPVGSDLWLDEFAQNDILIQSLELPESMSVLVATDGTANAPSNVSVTWPIENATPWAGPLIVAGAVMLAVGIFFYILGLRHVRRSRGPRRKGLPMPVTEPIELSANGDKAKGVISSTSRRKRRGLTTGRKSFVVVLPVIAALALSGCSADSWPELGSSPTPTPSASVLVPEGQKDPVVTEAQADRILGRIVDTVVEADANLDRDLAATRLDRAMLAARNTNYTLREKNGDIAAMPALPAADIEVLLPQAYDLWPRSVMMIVNDEASSSPNLMVMTQADPWAPYKMDYQAGLEAEVEVPGLAPASIGATQVPPDSSFLLLAPQTLSEAYADVIDNGEESQYASLFDLENDQLRAAIVAKRDEQLAAFNEKASETAELTFDATAGSYEPVSLLTVESGAIVAVDIAETDTAKPTNADAVIKLEGNPKTKALVGVDETPKGVTTTYMDQIFFYVPGSDSSEKIRLLGYSSDILDAKVIE